MSMKLFFITCRNNVITRDYWTRRQEWAKLIDYHRSVSTSRRCQWRVPNRRVRRRQRICPLSRMEDCCPFRQSPSDFLILVSRIRATKAERGMSTTMGHIQPKPLGRTDEPGLQFEPLLDSDEAAALLRIHPKTLQRMAREGSLTGIHIGKLWRFRASDLNKWIRKIAS
jgi:excisionase family DNA binding protein